MAKPKTPKRHYRLRVTAHVGRPQIRYVALESALMPRFELGLYGMQTVEQAADLIVWAESVGMDVVYDPPGNMADYFPVNRRVGDQSLFT